MKTYIKKLIARFLRWRKIQGRASEIYHINAQYGKSWQWAVEEAEFWQYVIDQKNGFTP